MTCDCGTKKKLRPVDHLYNCTLWDNDISREGFQVYLCPDCQVLWGCRFQWDAGSGNDDRWEKIIKGEENDTNV